MPLPKPKKKESRSEFVSRCAGNSTMNKDFPENKQRIAVCYSQWEKKKKETKGSVVSIDGEEFVIEDIE